MPRASNLLVAFGLALGCGGGGEKTERSPAPARAPVAESEKHPPTSVESGGDVVAEVAEVAQAEIEASRPRLEAIACAECAKLESGFAEHCLERVDAGKRERLGCGEASASGGYGFVVSESGSMESEDWKLSLRYVDATGKTVREGAGCVDEPGFDCEGPGRFLSIGDGRWLHHQGNAGDGTNDNALIDLSTGETHDLPEGEYALTEHPQRPVVGIFSTVPNFEGPDGEPAVRVQIGCFDLETSKLSMGATVFVPEAEADPIYVAEPARFEGDELVLAAQGRPPFRHRCKPSRKKPSAAKP